MKMNITKATEAETQKMLDNHEREKQAERKIEVERFVSEFAATLRGKMFGSEMGAAWLVSDVLDALSEFVARRLETTL